MIILETWQIENLICFILFQLYKKGLDYTSQTIFIEFTSAFFCSFCWRGCPAPPDKFRSLPVLLSTLHGAQSSALPIQILEKTEEQFRIEKFSLETAPSGVNATRNLF